MRLRSVWNHDPQNRHAFAYPNRTGGRGDLSDDQVQVAAAIEAFRTGSIGNEQTQNIVAAKVNGFVL